MDDPSDGCQSTLTIVNAEQELERASVWLADWSTHAGLSEDLTARLQVALDEVLSNIMIHAFADAPVGQREIGLGVRVYTDRVELQITDDGPAFDPTSVVPEERATRVAERKAGGVGLLFVRAMMDEVKFTRQSGRNCLSMCKRLATTA